MRRFKVRDRVRIVRSEKDPDRLGTITTIVGYVPAHRVEDGREGWDVDLPPAPCIKARKPWQQYACYDTEDLRLVRDGDEPGSWDELKGIYTPLPHKVEALGSDLRETITGIARALTR